MSVSLRCRYTVLVPILLATFFLKGGTSAETFNDRVGIGSTTSQRGEQLRVGGTGWAILGEYGKSQGAISFMPKDGTGIYHIANEGGQKLRFSVGDIPGEYEVMTIGLKAVSINGDFRVNGTKNFVHDHPMDSTKELVYSSLEGPEVGTYIRGTTQLSSGEAVVKLPDYFSFVTSDNGLTVQLTCIDECNGLRVVQKSAKQIFVKELLKGKSNAEFDYFVQGVRRGYEGHEVFQDKQ